MRLCTCAAAVDSIDLRLPTSLQTYSSLPSTGARYYPRWNGWRYVYVSVCVRERACTRSVSCLSVKRYLVAVRIPPLITLTQQVGERKESQAWRFDHLLPLFASGILTPKCLPVPQLAGALRECILRSSPSAAGYYIPQALLEAVFVSVLPSLPCLSSLSAARVCVRVDRAVLPSIRTPSRRCCPSLSAWQPQKLRARGLSSLVCCNQWRPLSRPFRYPALCTCHPIGLIPSNARDRLYVPHCTPQIKEPVVPALVDLVDDKDPNVS